MSKSLIPTNDLTEVQIASICDDTFLATFESFKGKGEDPRRLRERALHSFLEASLKSECVPYAMCVYPDHVSSTVDYLDDQGRNEISVASAICFPYGSVDTDFKVAETRLATARGATEVDVVLNYDRFKAGDVDYAKDDARAVVDAAHENEALVKLIIETCELSQDQIKEACHLADEVDADFVKTSTGIGAYGVTAEDLRIIRANFSRGVKMSGPEIKPENIRDWLSAASGRTDGCIELNPSRIRIGGVAGVRVTDK